MIFLLISFFNAVCCWALELPSDAEKAGRAIFVHQEKVDEGFKDHTADVQMILTNKGSQKSTRNFKLQVLENTGDGDKTLIIFSSPYDIRGTALLTYEHIHTDDDQWLYLPSLKRVKRIASRSKSGSFVGSELSFEDLASNKHYKYKQKLLNDDVLNGQKCWVIERYPLNKHSGYSRQVVWVSQSNIQNQRIDYYDRKNVLYKTAFFKEYKKYNDKFWRPHKITVNNVQNNKSTEMTVSKIDINRGLNKKTFTKNALERVR